MNRAIQAWLLLIVAGSSVVVAQEYDATDLFPPFTTSEELRTWLEAIDKSEQSRAAIEVTIADAMDAVREPTANIANDKNVELNAYRRTVGEAINAIRTSERKFVNDLAAMIDSLRAAQLEFAFEEFEYERLRQYCLRIGAQDGLPDIKRTLREASVDPATLAAQPRSRSQDDLGALVDAFWVAHAKELISGGSNEASNKVLKDLMRVATNLLIEWAKLANIDMEAVNAKRLCEEYPALCVRTPTDLAYDTAFPLVSEQAAVELKQIYEQYRERRSALRSILAEAQKQWDEPQRKSRRQAEYRRLLVERKNPDAAWQGHPGEHALVELFKIEGDTVVLIRNLVPEDVVNRSPPEVKFALSPLKK
jgi:hypothetical protein